MTREMYLRVEKVKFSSVIKVFIAWLLGRTLIWKSEKFTINGKEL